MKECIDIIPEKGQWYFSEGFITASPTAPEEQARMINHNKGASNMILGGPFETREQAEAKRKQLSNKHNPFVWQHES
jgi:hypothetical protein